jgi:FAD synthetase
MTTVLATGVFDILHAGHVFYLSEAEKLGDKLVVLITCDRVANNQKRSTILPQQERKILIGSLKMVDEVVIGREELDYLATLKDIRPDIIVLGYDQAVDEDELKSLIKNNGLKIEVARLQKSVQDYRSTTELIEQIKQRHK